MLAWARSLLRRRQPAPVTSYAHRLAAPQLDVQPPEALLNLPEVRATIRRLQQDFSDDQESFDTHIRPVLLNAAAFFQTLPASQNHHHEYPVGALQHAIEVAGITLRRAGGREDLEHLTPDERHMLQGKREQALVLLAIAHDAGKPVTDLTVSDPDQPDACWDPLSETLYSWASRRKLKCFSVYWNRSRRHREHEGYAAAMAWRWQDRLGIELPPAIRAPFKEALSTEAHPWSQLVMEADRESTRIDKERRAGTDRRASSLRDDVMLAIREQLDNGRWRLNNPGGPIWRSRYGVHLVHPIATKTLIAWLVANNRADGVPREPDHLAPIMGEEGLLRRVSTDTGIGRYRAIINPESLKEKTRLYVLTIHPWLGEELPGGEVSLRAFVTMEGEDLTAELAEAELTSRPAEPAENSGAEESKPESELTWESIPDNLGRAFLRWLVNSGRAQGGAPKDELRYHGEELVIEWKRGFRGAGLTPEAVLESLDNNGWLVRGENNAKLHTGEGRREVRLTSQISALVAREAKAVSKAAEEPTREGENTRLRKEQAPTPPAEPTERRPGSRDPSHGSDAAPSDGTLEPLASLVEDSALEAFFRWLADQYLAGGPPAKEPGGAVFIHKDGLAVEESVIDDYTDEPGVAIRMPTDLTGRLKKNQLLAHTSAINEGEGQYWVLSKRLGKTLLSLELADANAD